jgi:hypothetical protein
MDEQNTIRLRTSLLAPKAGRPVCCQECGARAPLRRVCFYRVGIFLGHYRQMDAHLCKPCIHEHFWTYTLTTLTLGWWRPVSLLATLLVVPCNVVQYVWCLWMPRSAPDRITQRGLGDKPTPYFGS